MQVAGKDASRQAPGLTDLMEQSTYNRLRCRAKALLRREASGHELEAADLVHEAFVRIARSATPIQFQDEGHIMAMTTIAMRRILVDHARSARSPSRCRSVPLDSQWDVSQDPVCGTELVHEVLQRLKLSDARLYRIVKMRFFLGLSNEEIASTLSISSRTVKRDWVAARIWLRRQLSDRAAQHRAPVVVWVDDRKAAREISQEYRLSA